MAQPVQGDLFDDLDCPEESRVDTDAFDRAIEHRLDEQSSITHVPGFVVGHGQLLTQLSTHWPDGSNADAGCTTGWSTSRV